MKEVELKFEIKNVKEIFEDLVLKSKYISSGYENTIMFDLDGLLEKKDARLRVRVIDSLTEKGNKLVEFCYKQPLTRKGIKVELEHETEVDDEEALINILLSVGFKEVSSYERIRHNFNKGNSKITIDVFPFANFLEIEGEEKNIIKLALELGFDFKDNLTESCDTIDHNRRLKAGLKPRDHIKFDNFLDVKKEQLKVISY